MKRFSVVALVALAVALVSQPAFSGTKKCPTCGTQISSTQENGGLYKFNENIKPFVPSDLTYANRTQQWSLICSKDGSAKNSPNGPVTGDCGDYISHGTNTKWRIHRGPNGVDRIFFVDKNGTPHRYVDFTGDSDKYRVVYLSQKAEQYAESNGYALDKRNNTMVAKGSTGSDTQVAQQPKSNDNQVANNEDCASKGSVIEKAKCVGQQSGAIGAVIKGLPKF